MPRVGFSVRASVGVSELVEEFLRAFGIVVVVSLSILMSTMSLIFCSFNVGIRGQTVAKSLAGIEVVVDNIVGAVTLGTSSSVSIS